MICIGTRKIKSIKVHSNFGALKTKKTSLVKFRAIFQTIFFKIRVVWTSGDKIDLSLVATLRR